MTMDQLTINARDIVVDANKRRVSRVGTVDYQAELGQNHLQRYLDLTAARSRRPENFHIGLNDSDLTVGFTVRQFGIGVPVTLRGNLVPEASSASLLDFVPSGGALGIVPVPAAAIDLALIRANPVIDLSRLKTPLTVAAIRVDHGVLNVTGTASIPPDRLSEATP